MIATFVDAATALDGLAAWRRAFRARLRDAFAAETAALRERVRTKLSGGVLTAKSGALRASIRAETAEDGDAFAARVYSDGSLPYARIQEYGGRIAVPPLAAKAAKALAFPYGGKIVFAKRTAGHTVALPERSYMRSSLEEFAPAFADSMRRIVADGLP